MVQNPITRAADEFLPATRKPPVAGDVYTNADTAGYSAKTPKRGYDPEQNLSGQYKSPYLDENNVDIERIKSISKGKLPGYWDRVLTEIPQEYEIERFLHNTETSLPSGQEFSSGRGYKGYSNDRQAGNAMFMAGLQKSLMDGRTAAMKSVYDSVEQHLQGTQNNVATALGEKQRSNTWARKGDLDALASQKDLELRKQNDVWNQRNADITKRMEIGKEKQARLAALRSAAPNNTPEWTLLAQVEAEFKPYYDMLDNPAQAGAWAPANEGAAANSVVVPNVVQPAAPAATGAPSMPSATPTTQSNGTVGLAPTPPNNQSSYFGGATPPLATDQLRRPVVPAQPSGTLDQNSQTRAAPGQDTRSMNQVENDTKRQALLAAERATTDARANQQIDSFMAEMGWNISDNTKREVATRLVRRGDTIITPENSLEWAKAKLTASLEAMKDVYGNIPHFGMFDQGVPTSEMLDSATLSPRSSGANWLRNIGSVMFDYSPSGNYLKVGPDEIPLDAKTAQRYNDFKAVKEREAYAAADALRRQQQAPIRY